MDLGPVEAQVRLLGFCRVQGGGLLVEEAVRVAGLGFRRKVGRIVPVAVLAVALAFRVVFTGTITGTRSQNTARQSLRSQAQFA